MYLACPGGRCALPAAPRWARTAVRAVGSALGQAHWSPPQAGATAGRRPTVQGISHLIACATLGPIRSPGGGPKPLRLVPSPASPVGPVRPAPLFAVWFSVTPGRSGGNGGRFLLALAVLLVCVSPPPLVVVRRRCVCLWRGACARGVCVGVCVVRLWWRGCGCVFRVCWCVCLCVWVCGLARLALAAGVGFGVVGVCRGWSIVTPGGRS